MYLLLCIHILFIVRSIDATDHKFDQAFKTNFPISNNKGTVGVASVSGVTSRNGRVSTIGGVKFFGPVSSSTQKKTQNWSKDDENMVTSVRIGPGALAVSSFAKIGDNTMRLQAPWPILHPIPWPIHNHFVPSNFFDRPLNIEKWLHKDIFESLESNNQMRNTWIYPSFDPFFNY